jgi:hypothetical protein
MNRGYFSPKSFKKKLLLIGCALLFLIGGLAYLFYEGFYDTNFRTMQDPIASTEKVDLTGLRELKASGGRSVNFADIHKRLSHIKGKIIIVDGMQYFHGYINGVPTTLLGYHVTNPGIRHYVRRLLVTGTLGKRPEHVISEAEEATKYGFDYKNAPIASREVPSFDTIDDLILFYEALPADAWVHFHCHHGKGRTSMMLVMLDIMRNAPHVALEDIVKRQHLLGSSNLFDTSKWVGGTYSIEELVNRKDFITDFYTFVCQRKKGGMRKWSEWYKQRS